MDHKPNFFIAGAPKCGTSALYFYLRQHPNIYMPQRKEPHHFATDLQRPTYVRDRDAYLGLFAESGAQHTRLGEASVMYLYSHEAIKNIHAFNPDARILVMFRDPVQMIASLHSQLLYTFEESEPDLGRAWALQSDRAGGHHIPETSLEPTLLQYAAVASFADQLERVWSIFPKEQVKVLFHDDLKKSTLDVYMQALGHLELPSDGRTEFPRINENKIHRSRLLARFLQRPPRIASVAKKMLGLGGRDLAGRLSRKLSKPTKRVPISEELEAEIRSHMAPQIRRLAEITQRDLSVWLNRARI